MTNNAESDKNFWLIKSNLSANAPLSYGPTGLIGVNFERDIMIQRIIHDPALFW